MRRIARAARAWLRSRAAPSRAADHARAASAGPARAVARRATIEEFEPRLLYSADSPLSALGAGALAAQDPQAPQVRLIDADTHDGGEAAPTIDEGAAPVTTTADPEAALPAAGDGTAQSPVAATGDPQTEGDVLLTALDVQVAAHDDTADTAGSQPVLTGLSPALGFERNHGQSAAQVDFVARGDGYGVYLTQGEAVIDLQREQLGHAIRLNLVGAHDTPSAVAEQPLGATSNYLIGAEDRWVTDVAQYGAVRYGGVWDGIDVRYYGTARQLEYDFIVAAGTDTDVIRLAFDGTAGVHIDDAGALVVTLDDSGRTIVFKAPVSHQTADDGTRIAVDSRYVLHDDGTVGFALGDYDHTRTLVIDPVLTWSTYLGGTGLDSASGVDVDASGNVYVTGRTLSSGFPTSVGAYDTSFSGTGDAFVAKFNSSGGLVYSTFFGGSGDEYAYNVEVDGNGIAYVVGQTSSTNLPIVNGANTVSGGGWDAYLLKLNAAGNAVLYSTYSGVAGDNLLNDVVVNDSGMAWVSGYTNVADAAVGVRQYNTAVSGAGSLGWTAFFGSGNGVAEQSFAMARDASGNLYVTGSATGSGLATVGAYDTAVSAIDAFVARITSTGTLNYFTYYGGTGNDYGNGIEIDSTGKVVIVGTSYSSDAIASTGAYDTTGDFSDGQAFAAKFDLAQTGSAQRVWGTYYGNSGVIQGHEIALMAGDRVVLTGRTEGSIQTTANALDASLNGGGDGFVAVLDASGSSLLYGSYFGGDGSDTLRDVTADASGNLYVVGETWSTTVHTAGAYDATGDGTNGDAVIAKMQIFVPPTVTPTGTTLAFTENSAPMLVDSGITVSDSDSTQLSGATVRISVAYDSTQDVLAFTNQLGITGTWNATTGTLTLSGTTTLANYQTALRTVTYANASDNPSGAVRTLEFTATDSDGVSSVAATRQLQVVGTYDEPVTTNASASGVEDAASIAVTLTGSDVDGTVVGYRVDALPANGTLFRDAAKTLSVVAGTEYAATGQALTLYYAPNANYSGVDTFTFSARDDWGWYDPTPATATITVTAVNDAPSLSSSSPFDGISEDDTGNSGMAVSTYANLATDADAGALKGIAVTAADNTNGTWQYTLDGTNWLAMGSVSTSSARLLPGDATARFRFVPNADWNGTTTLSYKAWDRTSGTAGALADTTVNGGTTAFSFGTNGGGLYVSPVNDAPTATITPASYAATEQVALALQGTGLSIADIDAGTSAVQATVSVGAGVLSAAAGTTGVTVSGSGTATVTLSGTLAQINSLLAGSLGGTLGYTANSDAPPASTLLTLTASDLGNTGSGGTRTGSDTATINITAVNDAPAGTNGTISVTEDTVYTFSRADFGFTDVDGNAFTRVIFTTLPSQGTLKWNGAAFAAGDFVTTADIDLGLLTYTPVANAAGTAVTSFTFQVRDDGGTANGGSNTDASPNTLTIDIAAVNDTPVNTVTGDGAVIPEDAVVQLLGAVSIADVDGGSGSFTVTLSVTPAAGALSASSGAGVTVGGSGSSSLVLSGTIAAINSYFSGGATAPIFTAAADFNGAVAFTVLTSDNGNTGSGGAKTDSDTVNGTISAVNDAPSGADGTIQVIEDTVYTFTAADFGFTDPVEGHAFTGVWIDTAPASGALTANASPVGSGTFVSAADIAAGLFKYTPAAEASGTAIATIGFRVQDAGGTANGGTNVDPSTNTLTVNVSAMTDAPADLVIVPGVPATSVIGAYTFGAPGNLGRDDAGGDAPIVLSGSPAQTTGRDGSGALDLAGGASGQYGNIAGITTGGAMTIAADVRFDSLAAWQRIVDFGQTQSTGTYAIYVGRLGDTSDLTFTLEQDVGGGVYNVYRANAAGAITNGSWMHVAATVDAGGQMSLYVDGALAASTAGVVPEVAVRTNNFIGRSNWGGDALFDGAIDNLVIANGAMSAGQVAALYAQGNTLTVAENAPNGTVLGTVFTSDPDAADTPTYSLTDSAGGRFAIGSDGTITVADGSLLDHESAASHTLVVRSADAGALWRDESVTVSVLDANDAPVAAAAGPFAIAEGGALVLSATGSSDPDAGDVLAYAWDLDNDGVFGEAGEPTTATPTVTWATLVAAGIDDDGTYTIGLRVTDAGGLSGTATTTVTVTDTAPTLTATGAGFSDAGTAYTLNLAATDPGADAITQWTVQWGDGTLTTYAGNPASVTHTYSAALAGLTMNITVSATDEDGTHFGADVLIPEYGGDHEVRRYDGSGAVFLGAFAQGDGLFEQAQVITGPDGNLYVSGFASSNVLRYAADGTLLGTFVAAGSGGLAGAGGIAFGPDGNLYVASYGTGSVLRYDGSTGAFIDTFASGGMSTPLGITFGPDGDLYVGAGNQVARFDGATGAALGSFVAPGSGGLSHAENITFGPDGDLFVADFDNAKVLRFDGATGGFVGAFVTGVANPAGVAFAPDGTFWVAEETIGTISRYDGTTGALLGDYVVGGGLSGPAYFSFAPDHQVLVGGTSLVVTTTADVADGDTSSIAALLADRGADDAISLREAILAANNTSGLNTIGFDIAGALVGGAHTIALTSALPDITDAVVIDGTTDPDAGALGRPVIELSGQNLGVSADGLTLAAGSGGSTIRGLAINRFHDGIVVTADSDGNLIVGNRIGTDVTGAIDRGNTHIGVYVLGDANTIGGSTAADRNVVSGNDGYGIFVSNAWSGGSDNWIAGNFIGVDAAGTAALGNGFNGVYLGGGSDNRVGGVNPGEGNVISANGDIGLRLEGAQSTRIEGNRIGTDATGSVLLGNVAVGVSLHFGTTGTVLGGVTPEAGNVIAGNAVGVVVDSAASADNAILGNTIRANAGLGIDLGGDGVTANDGDDADAGPNGLQNHPVLTWARTDGTDTRIVGTLDSTAGTTYRIEFYASAAGSEDASGHGEGATFLGTADVVTDAAGQASIDVTLLGVSVALGDRVTATATVKTGVATYGASSEFAMNVLAAPMNSAPTHTLPAPATATEDVALALTGVSVADAESNVVSTALSVTHGTLTVDLGGGATVSAGANGAASLTLAGTQAQINLALASLSYQGDPDYAGADLLQLVSTDALGESASDALAITVTAVNDAPALTLPGGGTSFTEGGGAVVLDAGVTVSDVELNGAGNFAGATLTLARNGGAHAQDVFSATGTLSSIAAASGDLAVGGTTIGTYTHGGGTLAITFNASATHALVDLAMQQIAYANTSNTPPASVQIDWSFSDGNTGAQGTGGALTAAGSTTVTITAVHTQPVAFLGGVGAGANGAIVVWDADATADGRATGSVTQGGTAFTVHLEGVDGTANGGITGLPAANYATSPFSNDVPGIGSASDNNTFRNYVAVDADAVSAGGVHRITFSTASGGVGAVVDPILLVNYTDPGSSISFPGLSADRVRLLDWDLSNPVQTGSTISFSGSNSIHIGVAVQLIGVFSSIDFTTASGASQSIGVGVMLPTEAGVQNIQVATTENAAPVSIAGAAMAIRDPDSTQLVSADVTLIGAQAGDQLRVGGSTAASGSIGAIGWTRTDTSVSFSGSASTDDYATALASVQFVHLGETPSAAARTVQVTVDDGSSSSPVSTSTITVAAVNDAPVFDALDGTPVFTEDGAAVVLDGNVTVGDAELSATDDFSAATLTLARTGGANSQDLFSASGTLTALTEGGSLVVDGTTIGTVTTNSGGTLVLSFNAQATNALVNSALRQIAYSNGSNTPPASVQIDWTFSDGNSGAQGSGGVLTATGATQVNITAVNDAPLNTVPGGLQTTPVNTALVFSIGTGRAIQVADVDAGTLQVTLSATNGTLTLSGVVGLGFSAGDGSADGTMTFTGTAAAINAALEGLSFAPTSAFQGSASIVLQTSDQGGTGSGGTLTDSDTVQIQVGAARFQQGVSGYAGTADTWVSTGSANTDHGSETTVIADDNSASDAALLRFDALFGSAPGQIPVGSTIAGATLSIYVTDRDLSDTVALHRMLSPWTESATYTSLGSGVQANGVEASSSALLTLDAGVLGWNNLSSAQLTAAVQAWANGQTNHGFAFISNAADLWTFASSENATVSLRPYLTVSFTPPQAPVVTTTPSPVAYTENGAPIAVDPNLQLTDADSTTLTGATVWISAQYVAGQDVLAFTDQSGITGSWNAGTLTLTGTATVAQYQAALRSITYANTSDAPDTALRTVSFVVDDGIADSAAALRQIAVSAVNDAPVLGLVSGNANYPENAGAVVLSASATVTDADSADFDGGRLVVGISANGQAEDRISIRNEGTGAGQIGLSAGAVTYGGVTIGSASGGSGAASPLIVTFNANASVAAVQALARNITYENVSEAPSTAVRTMFGYVEDGDGGTSNTVSGTLTIIPSNDAPVITSNGGGASAAVSVAENQTAVTVVTSSDPDSANRTYSIAGGADAALFSIDAVSGTLQFASAPDHETPLDAGADNVYDVVVLASDGSLSDTQAIAVTVTNVNEGGVSTLADTNAAADRVAENAAVGTAVGVTAFASDPDAPDTVSYTLDDNAGGRFSIDAAGVVRVAGALDREAAASHDVIVRATSTDGSFSTATFTIAVDDVDEFDVGAVTDGNAAANTVAENAVVGTAVGISAVASDLDATTNGITWSLDDDAGGRFSIDASGVVRVAGALDFETSSSHSVIVRATSDDGSFSTATFGITVTDVSEASIGATSDNDAAADRVAENAAVGTAVGVTALAVDPDVVDTVSYSLDDDAGGRFSIDAAGVVRVAGALDREATASHDVTVRATSTDGSFSTATFTIAVDDVDEFDVGAVTDGNAAADTVAESSAIGTAVGISALATDPDAATNAITWSLDDDAGGRFSIDAGGVVRVAGALDFETASSHSVIVRATSDDGSFSTATFGITVTDVSEASIGPASDNDAAADRVAENTAVGTAVGVTALAVDPDIVDTVSYSLDDDAGGRFSIDAAGVVRVAGALDRESAASHDVTVRATSTDGSFSTATFTIAIDDVDEFDVGAVTDGNAAANTVAENALIGTAVGISVVATDPDATVNAVTWTLDDDAGGRFSIDAGGVVRIANALDFETASSHSVIVRATSDDGSFSTATFGITVTDVSEAAVGPISDTDGADDRVSESAAIGTAVGIAALAVDPDVVDTVSYSLDDDAGGRFAIDAAGVVRVAGALDRESAASHDVVVRATSTDGSFSTATFTIAIDDVDEFDVGAITDGDGATNTVAESAAIGTTVGISALATDLDATTSAITWSLDDDAGGRFSIDAGGVVRVASALDFETASSHSVIVRATSDDGSFSTATFGITVTDTSEAAVGPLSDTDGADDRVNENATVGTAVGVSVVAVDPDIVDAVSYSLDDDAGGRFSIDAAGVVRVAGALDRESAASHDVIVRATSTDGSFSTAAFTIAVDDVDEFDVGAVTDGNAAANTVAENAAIGTAVGISALATDPDATTSALTWSLDDDAGGRFSIDAGGVIRVADLLDYETAASHAVIVRATSDDGSFSTATFDIAVTDVSESAVGPVADTDAAPDHVSEDAAIGTLVGITASAVDPDVLDSVTYTLDNDAGGRFSIDAAGVVRVAGALDREAAGSHEIVVRATSTDGTFSARIFTVAVDDVDEFDVGPVTDTNAAPNTVAESATTGSAVGITAGATDPDATTNGITWSLDNDAGGRFTIDGNGVVRVGNGLDYESATSHGIVVRATSADGSTSTQAFTIQVTDTNESGVGGISDVNGAANRVTENVGAGTAVGITASARDPDKSDSVSFSLENSAGNRFVIDAATGVVRTARLIDREVAASFDIVVRATSTDGSFSRQTFTIDVTDVDEHDVGAVFDANGADDTVPENALVGTTVGITARAVDADATNNGVRYTLVDNAGGRFSIDATSGVVRVAAKLDYETAPSHTIVVRATGDDGSTSTGSFVIAVADVGEYSTSPIQDANGAANAVQENAAIGTTVGITASAVDRDREDSVSYVLDDSAGGRFSIDADSGVVRVAGAIDREAVDALNIVVRAVSTDGSFTTRAFTIGVGGVNDNAPVITSGGGRALAWLSLEEGTTAATTMTAEDADVPVSATPLTWSIIGGSDATAFTLDARSGELRLRAEPDFEHPADADGDNSYEVLVRVSDGTNTASQLLNVRIVDRNEPSVARDDAYSTREDAALTVRAADGVLANDDDPDGGALAAVLVEGPAHGSVRLEADGSFTYTPSSEYAGRDSFSYRIRSGDTESNLAVVVIDVGAVDDAPVNIVPPAQTVTEDTALVFSGTGGNRISVSDPDAGDDLLRVRVAVDRGLISIDRIDGLTVESGDPAGDAALTLRGTESALDRALDGLRFTPLADWSGTARLTIVTAGVATDAPPAATDAVDITVRPANDAPVLDMPGRIVTAENERAILRVAAQDPDLPDERLRFSIDGGADAALFTVDAGSGALGWVDAPDYETPRDAQRANVYEVRVRVADDSGATDARTLRIEVTNVNEAPVVWATAGTDGGSAPIAAVAITDVDSGLITSATVRVANGAPADADQLMLTGAHAMQAYWNAADATLTLVGPASITQYEQALRAVMFETSDAAAPARLVTITVSDGALASPVSANAYAVGTALRASAPMLPLAPQPGSPATPDGTGLTGQPVGTTAGSTPSSTPYATTPTAVAGLTPVTPSLALPSTPSFTSPASITAPTTSTGTTPPGVTAPGTTPTGKALEAAAGATPSGTTGTTGATASPTAPARASTGLSPLTDALDALITASAPPAERLADPTRVTVLQGASTGLVSLRSDPAVLGGFALSQPLAEVLSLSLDTERTAAVAGLDLLLGMPGGGTGRTTVTVAADGLRIELTGSDAISVDALSTTTRVSGLAASALTLWWAARATGLAAALAASVPAWSSFDPLPIVDRPDAPRKGKAATRRPAPAGAAPAGAASAGAAAPTTTQTQTVQATPRTLLIMDDAR